MLIEPANATSGTAHGAPMLAPTPLQILGALELRAATSAHHQEVDRALGLPGSIQTLTDYRGWLERFFGLYSPLEASLRRFTEWHDWDIAIEHMGQASALACDLIALHCDLPSVELAPDTALPPLHSYARALGALYVLEGSKLGGRFILRDVAARLGTDTAGADAFFSGTGSHPDCTWTKFRASIDRFAVERPEEFVEVIEGARSTFVAVQQWMSPLRLSAPR